MTVAGVFSLTLSDLADRFAAWEKERRWQRSTLFENGVKPLFDAVEILHTDYAKSFGDYLSAVEGYVGCDGNPQIFRRIEYDMMLSSAARTKIAGLRVQARAQEMREFGNRINAYLRCAMRTHRLETYDNAPRLALLAELNGILRPGQERDAMAARRDHARAGRAIGRRLRQLDEKYGAIVAEFARLRNRLTM